MVEVRAGISRPAAERLSRPISRDLESRPRGPGPLEGPPVPRRAGEAPGRRQRVHGRGSSSGGTGASSGHLGAAQPWPQSGGAARRMGPGQRRKKPQPQPKVPLDPAGVGVRGSGGHQGKSHQCQHTSLGQRSGQPPGHHSLGPSPGAGLGEGAPAPPYASPSLLPGPVAGSGWVLGVSQGQVMEPGVGVSSGWVAPL